MEQKMLSNKDFSTFDIEIQHATTIDGVDINPNLNVAIVGYEIDDRSKYGSDYLGKISQIYSVVYNPIMCNITINTETIEVNELPQFIQNEGWKDDSIVIDCTSVNVPELLLLMDAFKKVNIDKFDTLYIEPEDYMNPQIRKQNKRDFELSTKYEGYCSVPLYGKSTHEDDVKVFCCGYEVARIQNAMDALPIGQKYTYILFGMPPFYSGWDMNAYYNHINFIDEHQLRDIYFCGATNPLAVLVKLENIYNSLQPEQNLFLAPIGTKPMSLAVCLFLVEMAIDGRCALLFDHPLKKDHRTTKIGEVNLYKIHL